MKRNAALSDQSLQQQTLYAGAPSCRLSMVHSMGAVVRSCLNTLYCFANTMFVAGMTAVPHLMMDAELDPHHII
jgi:hypothetical protein